MGNCNTCNCDGKGDDQPNEFTINVPPYYPPMTHSIGASSIHESLQLTAAEWECDSGGKKKQF